MARRHEILRVLLIQAVLLGAVAPAFAADISSIDCGPGREHAITADNAYHDVYSQAVNICLGMAEMLSLDPPIASLTFDANLRLRLADFGDFAARALERDFGSSTAIKVNPRVNEMRDQLAKTDVATGHLPKFETTVTISANLGYFSTAAMAAKFEFPDDHPDCRKVKSVENSCKAVFDDFKAAFNAYRKAYDQVVTGTNRKLLETLNRDWDRFLNVSKSQTALEVWLTTLWHSKQFRRNYIVGPPSSQIIALHPQLVYEYVSKADNGDNAAFGLAVEWLGINYWNWTVPVGLSVTSVYTDRVSVPDVRTGLMLHIDNKYSLGWGRRDGKDGFYVTTDLLQLLDSKKQKYERYIK